MLTNTALNPLRVAKQRITSYASQLSSYSDDVDNIDIEKRRISLSESEASGSPRTSSTMSSRNTSQAFEPMLRSSPVRRPKARSDYARSYPRMPMRLTCYTLPPRWSSRLFSFGLLAILILFITSLARSHWSSIKIVESLEHKPAPPPPAWEAFPFLKRYHGGIRTLVAKSENSPEYPQSAGSESKGALQESGHQHQNSEKARGTIVPSLTFDPFGQKRSKIVPCFLDEEKGIRPPDLQVYPGVPSGMPEPVMGSYALLGLRDDVCFDRYGRLGPYGFGYSKKMGGTGTGMDGDREGIEAIWAKDDYVDYSKVKWAQAIKRCEAANKHRFEPLPSTQRANFYQTMGIGGPEDEEPQKEDHRKNILAEETPPFAKNRTLPRTAVVIRTWTGYEYDNEDLFYLRSLVAELSLASGGEYSVHFLVHVKDNNKQIWADDATYQQVLDDALPAEFKGMGTLWSERQMELIYGGLEETNYRNLKVHGVYRSTFQPLQYFAKQHPEYDFYWQLEMDMRYTGHWYHLFDRISQWSAQQPRKGLWERDARFYIPSEHGSWEDFSHMVRVQTEHGTASKANMYAPLQINPSVPEEVKAELEPSKPEKPIWGPEPPIDDQLDTTNDPKPPTSEKEDKHEWGVGEEADLILFNPIFDPEGTNWILAQDVTGYNKEHGLPPRRVAINTFGRYSKKLLLQMHVDTLFGRKSMFSEMYPASTCLHHGFKAVYAPHPVFIDRRWPTSYLASIFNGGRNGAAGGARLSVFSDERQHNFRGTTWYYDAGFAPNLWKRWLGLKVDNDGGEQEEVLGEGRMCLPAMMLHPVKHVDLRVEKVIGDEG
ncbi:uncharacterized protein PV09_03650 [Verruconis gallopava]|uniref:Uncharacterized protein n=1 Tax=Verruconis gallopava TaxID=253628 RepID=A0A0D2ADN4_9PEZI|nr:uncharacterized protein PV09_03650 [Verruconis gallopava]KIW05093.1 hypothetical protein PV09_03650 [Verruconis gallopava]